MIDIANIISFNPGHNKCGSKFFWSKQCKMPFQNRRILCPSYLDKAHHQAHSIIMHILQEVIIQKSRKSLPFVNPALISNDSESLPAVVQFQGTKC